MKTETDFKLFFNALKMKPVKQSLSSIDKTNKNM